MVLRRLFPHISDSVLRSLQRADDVDILIGISHPSWHPERAERAVGKGDLWLFRGRFGVCIGGRHGDIKDATRVSKGLFSVNQAFFISEFQSNQLYSHELEFCAVRSCPVSSSSELMGKLQSNSLGTPGIRAAYAKTSGVCMTSVSSGDARLDVNEPACVHCCGGSCGGSCLVDQSGSFVIQQPESAENIQSDLGAPAIRDADAFCGVCMTSVSDMKEIFFESESLGTNVVPRCGGCRCGKCPVPGSQFSFKEQQEHDVIAGNLIYKEAQKRWFTSYPWLCPRSALSKNDGIAYQSLMSLEKNLRRNPDLAQAFLEQIDEMVSRGAAVLLSDEDLSGWEGDYFYLPMVGVKSKSKRFRVCFDASRKQGSNRTCLNDCLMKGPDRFLNNLLSVIVGFRNGRVGAAADIAKFHNQVYLTEEDMHMQRFLWRRLDFDAKPVTYAVRVNNFGVKPANCIATCALRKSADSFEQVYPSESEDLKKQTYIDDILTAGDDRESTLTKTSRIDEILDHAGMPAKGWTLSGDQGDDVSIGVDSSELSEKVLGVKWKPVSDSFSFVVVLGFGDVEVRSTEEFHRLSASLGLTRRIVLSNVAKVFDPVGFLCPVILEAKLLMRESWCGEAAGWDDKFRGELSEKWLKLFSLLFDLEEVEFSRALWPVDEVVGLPILVVFSDGSALAYGSVAYIRWKLLSGGVWTRLVMAKSKIAPKNILSIPRMELNGAVLGSRLRNFLVKETSLVFEKVLHLVDSSTVLGYLHKVSGAFKPYEGIRIAEIQSGGVFMEGRLEGWAWIAGEHNPADWCTKSRTAKDLASEFWQSGPDFLRDDESCWPIKWSYRQDKLEGEIIKAEKEVHCHVAQVENVDYVARLLTRVSSWKKAVRVFAWMLRVKSKRKLAYLSVEELAVARSLLIQHAQLQIASELEDGVSGKGRFRKLAPVKHGETWRVGTRMRLQVPFTLDSELPVIVPDGRLALLIMEDCHRFCHAGQDGTLCRFRAEGYWLVRAGHLAKTVVRRCIPCRKIRKVKMSQRMGEFSEDRLKEPMAWGYCQLDLFGPFLCRGDVNPRTSKKTWGMVIEDLNSGAVHLDIVQDYSTNALLATLRRFGSLRGWPGVICTDPGSQLESAKGILEHWWIQMEHPLRDFGSTKNFRWNVSPPDSAWRQGKAERRIAVVKKLLNLAVADSRLTPVELQTVLFEVSNICNERPITLSKPREDGTYAIITSNQLLLGRSRNILPDDTVISDVLSTSARYRLLHHVTTVFWQRWSSEVSPGLVVRQKWHSTSRQIKVGDIVMVCDSSEWKAKYRLAVVDAVNVSCDGLIRSGTLRYAHVGEQKTRTIRIQRSVQRLVMILPVEEQSSAIRIEDDGHSVTCYVDAQ